MSTATSRLQASPAWRHRIGEWSRAYGAVAALVVLTGIASILEPNFATPSTLWNILLQASPTVLVAVGMTLVIATRGVDLSVGSVMAVASAVATTTMEGGAVAAALAGLAAAGVLGAVNGVLVGRYRAEPFIVTLALQLTGRGLAQVVCHEGQAMPFSSPWFEVLGKGHLGPVPVPVMITALVVLTAAFVMRSTTLGRHLVAVGGNERAAQVAGIPVVRTRLVAYLVSGLLAGLAGLIETARMGATDPSNLGGGMEFGAIFSVVIGGTPLTGGRATIVGTVAGALILAVLGTAFNMLLVPFALALMVQAGIILLAVYVQRPPPA